MRFQHPTATAALIFLYLILLNVIALPIDPNIKDREAYSHNENTIMSKRRVFGSSRSSSRSSSSSHSTNGSNSGRTKGSSSSSSGSTSSINNNPKSNSNGNTYVNNNGYRSSNGIPRAVLVGSTIGLYTGSYHHFRNGRNSINGTNYNCSLDRNNGTNSTSEDLYTCVPSQSAGKVVPNKILSIVLLNFVIVSLL